MSVFPSSLISVMEEEKKANYKAPGKELLRQRIKIVLFKINN